MTSSVGIRLVSFLYKPKVLMMLVSTVRLL